MSRKNDVIDSMAAENSNADANLRKARVFGEVINKNTVYSWCVKESIRGSFVSVAKIRLVGPDSIIFLFTVDRRSYNIKRLSDADLGVFH